MKIREVLDRLDEISRRDFLKGAGAAAVGGLASKASKADWSDMYDRDLLTNKFEMLGSNNFSEEDRSVILAYTPKIEAWSVWMSYDKIPEEVYRRLNWGRFSNKDLFTDYSFRILLGNTYGNQIIRSLERGTPVILDTTTKNLMFVISNREINSDVGTILQKSRLNEDDIKIEISIGRFKLVYTFLGKKGPNMFIQRNDLENKKTPSNQQRSNIKDI